MAGRAFNVRPSNSGDVEMTVSDLGPLTSIVSASGENTAAWLSYAFNAGA